MKEFIGKEVLAHPVVLGSCVVSVCIALGSVWYYRSETTLPATVHAPIATPAAAIITAQGTVLPSENPDLSFETSGRVAAVNVQVGDTVAKGEVLATLDTAALSAARDQAQANLHLAQAKLDALKAGPRPVDVSAKQTAVAQTQQALTNLYTQVPNDLGAAYSNSLGAVSAYTDSLYNSPYSNPTLAFSTADLQIATDAGNTRTDINALMDAWQATLAQPTTDQAALDQELAGGISNLSGLRAYANLLTRALAVAGTNGTFTAASVTAANTNLGLFRASVSASLATLQADQQQLASQRLAVQSAQNALAQLEAPATQQDLEAAQAAVDAAQATLSSAQAALGNAVITAPFAGSVSAVRAKVGDLASPALAAVSLTPQSALEIDGYLSEADAALVAPGDQATVTLDAFGSGHTFGTTVSSVDRAPTKEQGVPAYKVVLEFNQNDPSLASGMTANISITPHQ